MSSTPLPSKSCLAHCKRAGWGGGSPRAPLLFLCLFWGDRGGRPRGGRVPPTPPPRPLKPPVFNDSSQSELQRGGCCVLLASLPPPAAVTQRVLPPFQASPALRAEPTVSQAGPGFRNSPPPPLSPPCAPQARPFFPSLTCSGSVGLGSRRRRCSQPRPGRARAPPLPASPLLSSRERIRRRRRRRSGAQRGADDDEEAEERSCWRRRRRPGRPRLREGDRSRDPAGRGDMVTGWPASQTPSLCTCSSGTTGTRRWTASCARDRYPGVGGIIHKSAL